MNKNISLLFLIFYLATTILPGFAAIDRIAFHWLYVSVLNAISLIWIIFSGDSRTLFLPLKNNFSHKIFITFFLVCIISLFYSINLDESLINIKRLFILFVSLLSINYHVNSIQNISKVLSVVLILLIVEAFLPLKKFVEIIIATGGYNFSFANDLETFAPNKNITAAILTIHLGLIFYFTTLNKKLYNILIYLLVFACSISIILISSRAMILSLIISFLAIIFTHLFYKTKFNFQVFRYFGIVIISSFLINFYLGTKNDVSLNNRLTTLNTEDQSTNQRLRFYVHGINHIIENPIIGVGLGNWKLKSVEYESPKMLSYIVPYSLHNDFLQYGTEIGIIGMLIYLFLFIYIIYTNFLCFKKNYFLSISLLISSITFFIDSNLNFPHQRVSMMILFILIIVLTDMNKKLIING